MKTVYVVNDSGHDYSKAEKFGRLVFMSTRSIYKTHVTKMYKKFKRFINESGREDYLLISGPSLMNVIACSMFARKHGKLNLLIWDEDPKTKKFGYISRTVNTIVEVYDESNG